MRKYNDQVATPYGIIEYTVTVKGVRNLSVHLSKEGKVLVSVPYLTPAALVQSFIEKNAALIIRAKEKVEKRNSVNEMKGEVTLWGKTYPIIYRKGTKRLIFAEDAITVYYPEEDYEAWLGKELKKILSKEVERIRGKYDAIIAEYHIKAPEIRYREMSSQWGNCRPKVSRVTLNTRLIHYPKVCLEYVMLHEYMHFLQPNHSKSFHALLKHYMPEYRQIEKMLK